MRGHLLPREFSQTGEYSKETRDHARGFRLLIHAEIEAYIEDKAREILVGALKDWKANNSVRNVLLALLVFWNRAWMAGNQAPNKTQLDDVASGVNQAAKEYFFNLKSNHGIKEKNLLSVLAPIGIDLRLLDAAWVAAMDSFGENRGIVAHSSVSSSREIDPAGEWNSVGQLIEGLNALDEKFEALFGPPQNGL